MWAARLLAATPSFLEALLTFSTLSDSAAFLAVRAAAHVSVRVGLLAVPLRLAFLAAS